MFTGRHFHFQQGVYLFGVHGFFFEQGVGQQLKLVQVGMQDITHAFVGGIDNQPYLQVYLPGGLLPVVLAARQVPSQENMLSGAGVVDKAHFLAHAPLADHFARYVGGLHDIHGGSGGDIVKDHFLGQASAYAYRDMVQQFFAREMHLVLLRQVHGGSQIGRAARYNGDFMQRGGVFAEHAHQGVAGLMVGGQAPVFLVNTPAAPLLAPAHLVPGLFQLRQPYLVQIASGGQQCRLIDQVGQVGAGKARRAPGDDAHVGFGVDGDFFGVHIKYG